MKLEKEELLKELHDYTGDRTDDETLKLIEDVSDSLDADGNGKTDSEDWQAKYNDLAKKYKDRFTESVEVKEDTKDEDDKKEEEEEKAEKISADDLFTDEKKEGKD